MTFAEALEEAAAPEPVLKIVLGDSTVFHARQIVPATYRNRVLLWDEARPLLAAHVDEYQAFYAWTRTRVLFAVEYDGQTSIHAVPRSARRCAPAYNGEG